MKFPEYRLSMEAALPSSVQTWLEQELDLRGIDSLVYTRYVISLLQRGPEDFDSECFDRELDFFSKSKVELKRSKSRKLEKKNFSKTEEDKKKLAAIECLTALSDENAEIEKLVEELCSRLKDLSASQASVCPVVDIQSANSASESSEDSGSENQNPAERYYAAFPSLNETISPAVSPVVTSESVWSKSKVVVKNPAQSNQDTDKDGPCKTIDVKEDKKEGSSSRQSRLPEKKKRLSSIEKKKYNNPSKLYRSKSSKISQTHSDRKPLKTERNQSWPPGFTYLELEALQTALSIQQNVHEEEPEKENPIRENEALCTRVESLLKGMLLPVPEKTYKELEDVDDDCVFEQRERISQPSMEKIVDDITSTKCEEKLSEVSQSPELQEQDIWYTQPLDIIFQQGDETSSRHLYERSSLPRFSPDNSSATSPSSEPTKSSNCSPQKEDRDDQRYTGDTMEGSVLIPAWMTDELCIQDVAEDIQGEPIPNAFDTQASSYKSEYFGDDSLPFSSVEDHQCLFNLKSPEEIWESSSNKFPNFNAEAKILDVVPHESRKWSTNDDDDGDFFTPVPGSQASKIENQLPVHSQPCTSFERPVSTESVSLLDMEYLSSFLKNPEQTDVGMSTCFNSTMDNSTLEIDDVWTLVNRQPYVSSLLQNDNLFDSWPCRREPVFTDHIEGWTEFPCWQPTGNGESLSQLWNINQQKKRPSIDDRTPDLQAGFTDPWGGLFGQNDYRLSWLKDLKSQGRENTLIPQISFEGVTDEDLDENVFIEPDEVRGTVWNRNFEKSLSFGDMRSIYAMRNLYAMVDPKIVPSERSAFVDVSNLHHVHSEPNLVRFRQGCSGEVSSKSQSPQEHLFYSPKTHFRPITPANSLEQSKPKPPKLQEYTDLFGGHLSSKTPYQQYHGKQLDDDSESFVPQFKIKNSNKYIQTGESLDNEEPLSSPEISSNSEECETPEALTVGMLEEMVLENEAYVAEPKGKVDEDLDNANTDSAYETDYGMSVTEPSEHPQNSKVMSPETLGGEKGLCDDVDGFGLATQYYTSLNASPQGVDKSAGGLEYRTEQQSSHVVGKETHGSPVEEVTPWGASSLWGTDIDDDNSGGCDGNSQSWIEKYRNIWSSGVDAFMPDFSVGGISSTVEQGEGHNNFDSGDHGAFDPDGYFRVKIVNKDKLRYGDDPVKRESSSYGLSDLMPMPNDAKLSSELEKEWLDPEMQFLSWISRKKSRSQRKPCSFFLEGHCRRSDCKFAHDISNITCRFWEEGGCFKGPLCPFLHGYPSGNSSSEEETASKATDKELFDLKTEEFPDLGQTTKTSGSKKSRPNRSQHSHGKDKGGRKSANSRRSNCRTVRQDKK